MALQRDVNTASGISVTESYARIDSRSGANGGMLSFTLNYYINKQAADEGRPYVMQESYQFQSSTTDNAPNDIKQGYEYLKSLADFANATDV